MISRREFFKRATMAVAAASTVSIVGIGYTSIAFAASDPRAKAWLMLEELNQIHKADPGTVMEISGPFVRRKPTPKFLSKTDEFFTFIDEHFMSTPINNEEETIAEVKTLLREPEKFTLATCSDMAFCVVLIRHALKNYKLPIIRAKGWRPLAGQFTRLVMAA